MRFTGFVFLFSFVLASCAFSQKQEESLAVVLNIRRPKTLANLKGKTDTELVSLLGEPLVKRIEKPYQSWVYKTYDCVVFVFLDDHNQAVYTQTRGICQKAVAGYELKSNNAS